MNATLYCIDSLAWLKGETSESALEEQRSSIQGLAQVAEILTLMITCMLEKTFDMEDVTYHE